MHYLNKHAPCRGFSLVELSIVLVILGLLVGGVLTGKSLIRASEIRKYNTEHQSYLLASKTFREKYFSLAGDMTNATQFWGLATGGAVCYSGINYSLNPTCNGNGDGTLSIHTYNAAGDWSGLVQNAITGATGHQTLEVTTFWQQLANAGLLSRSGTYGEKIANNAMWNPKGYPRRVVGYGSYFDGDYGLGFLITGIQTGPDPVGIFSPQELYGFDTKFDDGRPGYGNIRVHVDFPNNVSLCTNATGGSPSTAIYLISNTERNLCSVYFLGGL